MARRGLGSRARTAAAVVAVGSLIGTTILSAPSAGAVTATPAVPTTVATGAVVGTASQYAGEISFTLSLAGLVEGTASQGTYACSAFYTPPVTSTTFSCDLLSIGTVDTGALPAFFQFDAVYEGAFPYLTLSGEGDWVMIGPALGGVLRCAGTAATPVTFVVGDFPSTSFAGACELNTL